MNLSDLEKIKQKFAGEQIQLKFVNYERELKTFAKRHRIDLSNFLFNNRRQLTATVEFQKLETVIEDGVRKLKVYDGALLLALDKQGTGQGSIYDVNQLFLTTHPDNFEVVECHGNKCRKRGEKQVWCESCSGDIEEYSDWIDLHLKSEIYMYQLAPEMVLGSSFEFWDLHEIKTLVKELSKGSPTEPVITELINACPNYLD